jgi:hypothetical protein
MAEGQFGNFNMNLFFVRNSIDLDFMMPIIVESKQKIICQYEKFSIINNNKKLLVDNNIELVKIHNSLLINLTNFFLKACSRINLLNCFQPLLTTFQDLILYQELKKINYLYSGNNNVIFDHTNSEKVKAIIRVIQNKFKSRNKFIAVPHGINIFKNRMNEYIDIKPPQKVDFTFFDLVICSDKGHFETILAKKKVIIYPLRYTREWVERLIKFKYKKKIKKKSDKKKVLIVHSKFSGNVNDLEFYRIIKILKNMEKFEITIKLHPRSTKNENSEIKNKCKECIFSRDDILNLVNQSDLIIFFQSSAILDAILLNKSVIFPVFATSNQLISSLKRNITSYHSPDQFYKGMLNLKVNMINKNIFQSPKYCELLSKWNDIFNKNFF